jgi:hypothetical protein
LDTCACEEPQDIRVFEGRHVRRRWLLEVGIQRGRQRALVSNMTMKIAAQTASMSTMKTRLHVRTCSMGPPMPCSKLIRHSWCRSAMSLPCNVVRKCVGCSGVHMRPDADPCGRAYPCGRALWRFLWSFLSRRSGRRCRMSHDVGPVHGRIDGSTFRLAHDAGPGVRVRGGARGRYWVWTQDGIVLSLCASDILTCVFG